MCSCGSEWRSRPSLIIVHIAPRSRLVTLRHHLPRADILVLHRPEYASGETQCGYNVLLIALQNDDSDKLLLVGIHTWSQTCCRCPEFRCSAWLACPRASTWQCILRARWPHRPSVRWPPGPQTWPQPELEPLTHSATSWRITKSYLSVGRARAFQTTTDNQLSGFRQLAWNLDKVCCLRRRRGVLLCAASPAGGQSEADIWVTRLCSCPPRCATRAHASADVTNNNVFHFYQKLAKVLIYLPIFYVHNST